MKKVAIFAIQIIVATIIFDACMYVFNLIDHGTKDFDWTLLIQGLIFAIIYVPFSNWWTKKKSQKANK